MKALRIRNLKKTYAGGVQALRGIDLDVGEGDFFALLGPNGAGKSTTIGVICSLVNKSEGSVEVLGYDQDLAPEAVKSCIGYVPQEFNFNPFEPVGEILINQAGYYGLPRVEARRQAEHCLRQLELWDKREEQARSLSGGMKRRLMIARALVHRPRLLILDEPTAGVDIEIRLSMWEFLRAVNADGTTIILTTHYLEEAENLCRNIAIINDGQIAERTEMSKMLRRLHQQDLIIDVVEPVEALPEIPGYRLKRLDACMLEAEVTAGRDLNGLFEGLLAAGIQVLSMRNKQNRLEQLFLDMVQNHRERSA